MVDNPGQSSAQEKTPPRKKEGISGDVIAYGGAGAAGLLSMWASVRESFLQKMRAGELKDLHEARQAARAKLGKEFRDGPRNMTREQYFKELGDLNKFHAGLWTSAIKKMGFESLASKFLHINKFERAKVGVIGLTIFTVGLGATLTLQQRHRMTEELNRLDSQRHQQPTSSAR